MTGSSLITKQAYLACKVKDVLGLAVLLLTVMCWYQFWKSRTFERLREVMQAHRLHLWCSRCVCARISPSARSATVGGLILISTCGRELVKMHCKPCATCLLSMPGKLQSRCNKVQNRQILLVSYSQWSTRYPSMCLQYTRRISLRKTLISWSRMDSLAVKRFFTYWAVESAADNESRII